MAVDQYTRLPTKLYKVKIPVVATYTEDDIEMFGLPSDEKDGKKVDGTMNLTNSMINIDRMIDLYSEGHQIIITDPKDVTEIYETLENYLSGRLGMNETFSLNRKVIKETREIEIDKFISEMFDLNRRPLVKSQINITNTGFGLGVEQMNIGPNVVTSHRRRHNGKSERTGFMKEYGNDHTPIPISNNNNTENEIGVNYLTNTQPNIDIDKIQRNSKVSKRRGVRLGDFEKRE